MTSEFYYTGIDAIKIEKSERGTYCTFSMFHRETGVKIAEIITNASLCGSWHRTAHGELVQDAGTCVYSLPGTPAGIRKALRVKAANTAGLIAEIGATDADIARGYTQELAQKIFEALK